jgi:hypothetical protein
LHLRQAGLAPDLAEEFQQRGVLVGEDGLFHARPCPRRARMVESDLE